ncbi:hypothetical protein V5O48_006772 [Marasmius crinis-equi]|uniref:Uncharacterized protein n=1 Tax=Marasmius crinis-equi TaxID=585013 RepID=A0ABR3FIM6_9AGAR
MFSSALVPRVLVNSMMFHLRGKFTADISTFSVPAHLFHQVLRQETTNEFDQRDISPLSEPFYWSLDPDGGSSIPKERQENYGIPECNVSMRVGLCWKKPHYAAFCDHFRDESQGDDDKRISFAVQLRSNKDSIDDPHAEDIGNVNGKEMGAARNTDSVDKNTNPEKAMNVASGGDAERQEAKDEPKKSARKGTTSTEVVTVRRSARNALAKEKGKNKEVVFQKRKPNWKRAGKGKKRSKKGQGG